jgi:hypothetical protein
MAEPHRVELRAARVPFVGAIAHHHWLVIERAGQVDRWEVWQRQNAGGESWGHLHRNLLAPDSGVGSGPSWLIHAWAGEQAQDLAQRLERSIDDYPWCHRYRYWPGPNSNTFAQWVLGDLLTLPVRAPGKHFAKFAR